jgi:hypothetical protein
MNYLLWFIFLYFIPKIASRILFPVALIEKCNAASQKLMERSQKVFQSSEMYRTSEEVEFLQRIDDDNQEALKMLESLEKDDSNWEFVAERQGIQVFKRFIRAGPFVKKSDLLKGQKHACVKSVGILNANADKIFELFLTNDRVHEYNDHCVEVQDLQLLPTTSQKPNIIQQFCKVAWARSPIYGVFKPRDFISVVYCEKRNDGSYIIMNRPAYVQSPPMQPPMQPPLHTTSSAKRKNAKKDDIEKTSKYVRATILLGGNILQPINTKQTKVTMIAHVNPGGGGDTQTAAWFINKMCAREPQNFLKKLEIAANKIIK